MEEREDRSVGTAAYPSETMAFFSKVVFKNKIIDNA
jgi:hypothetical protein